MKEPVTLRSEDVETTDVSTLALRIAEEQVRAVGVEYGYCTCGAAIHAETAHRARKRGRMPMCRHCAISSRLAEKRHDAIAVLCDVCRVPLEGKRASNARSKSKRGWRSSCGKPECVAELRKRQAFAYSAKCSRRRQEREDLRNRLVAPRLTPEKVKLRQSESTLEIMTALTPEQRKGLARRAAAARWANYVHKRGPKCATDGCDSFGGRGELKPSRIARRKGAPYRCKRCCNGRPKA